MAGRTRAGRGRLVMAVAAIVGLAAGPAGAGACPKDQLGQLRRGFEAAMRSKQRERVLALYSPDAVFLDEVSRRLQGRAQLETLYATVFARYDSRLRLRPIAIARRAEGTGVVCDEAGRFSEDLSDRTAGTVQHTTGPYRFAYARGADGRWRFILMDWRRNPAAPSKR